MCRSIDRTPPGSFQWARDCVCPPVSESAAPAQAPRAVSLPFSNGMIDAKVEHGVYLLALAALAKSEESMSHVRRVGLISETLAIASGIPAEHARAIGLAAPLHDIGKVTVPEEILRKPGSHTPEEAAIMRGHAEAGRRMLSATNLPLLCLAAEIAGAHHENWDGSGYPRGLAAGAIPLSARVVALADVFDALSSRRCYKDAWGEERVQAFIVEQRAKKFDPRFVDVLIRQWTRIGEIRRQIED